MCGPVLLLSLLLWIRGTAGLVTAPASLTVEVGGPLRLGCNITMSPGDSVQQVRWHKHNKVLLAYVQSVPPQISVQDPNVLLSSSSNGASFIEIKRVGATHEGCYRCVFDVYPSGSQEAKTCVGVTGRVRHEGNKTAVNGKSSTLSCWFPLPNKVHQVLWTKTAEQGDSATVAFHYRKGQPSVEELFAGRVGLGGTFGDSQLTIKEVRTEDEGCYTCEFHTYPEGIKSSTACLSVYVLPKPEVNHVTSPSGFTEANCTAQSRPPAEITWDVGGENKTVEPPVLSSSEQGDGTTIVTSTLLFQSGVFSDSSIKCVVHHPGLEKPLTVPLHSNVGPAMVILLSMCGVAGVLLLCLFVCLCKCFICADF
ncbi:nectin-3-like [Halichoeres trimaculatus]|uniref:nectin-3-like n=1 Tax=Halichoeres trimaculatus TaxID=147232 RepID=UPI003D9EED86